MLAPSIRAASCVAGRAWIKALCRQGGEALQRGWRCTPRQQNEIERLSPGCKTAITGARRNPLLSWPRSLSLALILAGLLALVIELR